MSECVVRMEMPQGCGSCPVANFGYCSINHKPVADSFMGYPENRPANCPIICSLPEGHGRLVDAVAFSGHALDGTGPEMSEKAAVAILAQAIRHLQNYVAYLEGKVKKK